jgi:uncharacterized membrane-anchored protein YhcB (DUF1043 family)
MSNVYQLTIIVAIVGATIGYLVATFRNHCCYRRAINLQYEYKTLLSKLNAREAMLKDSLLWNGEEMSKIERERDMIEDALFIINKIID